MARFNQHGQNGESTSNACTAYYPVDPAGMTPTDLWRVPYAYGYVYFLSGRDGALRAECTNKPIRLTVANAAPV